MQGLKFWTMYVSEQKICIMQHYILFANIILKQKNIFHLGLYNI